MAGAGAGGSVAAGTGPGAAGSGREPVEGSSRCDGGLASVFVFALAFGAGLGVVVRGMTTDSGGDITRGGVPLMRMDPSPGAMLLPSSLGVRRGAEEGGVLPSESMPKVPRRIGLVAMGESGASGIEGSARATGAGIADR